MILIDVNLLLYAYDPDSPQPEKSQAWLVEVFSGIETVMLPWQSIHAFLRISTNRRAFPNAFNTGEAASIVSSWLQLPAVTVVNPGERHWQILESLLGPAQISGPLVTDAVLAALAIEHGATLCSADRDFRRFDGLRLLNPLEA